MSSGFKAEKLTLCHNEDMFDKVVEETRLLGSYCIRQTFLKNGLQFDMVASFFYAVYSCHFQTCHHIVDLLWNIFK